MIIIPIICFSYLLIFLLLFLLLRFLLLPHDLHYLYFVCYSPFQFLNCSLLRHYKISVDFHFGLPIIFFILRYVDVWKSRGIHSADFLFASTCVNVSQFILLFIWIVYKTDFMSICHFLCNIFCTIVNFFFWKSLFLL